MAWLGAVISPEQVRRWGVILVTSLLIGGAVVDADPAPAEPVREGEVARRTVRAPFAFVWRDRTALDAERTRVEAAEPPVFVLDEGLVPELAGRLTLAFREASKPGLDAAAATEAFRREAGVPVDTARITQLAAAGFPEEALAQIRRWWVEGYGDRLVPLDRAELPPDGKPIRVVPLAQDRDAFLLGDRGRVASLDDVRRAVTVASLRQADPPAWTTAAEQIAVAMVRPNLYLDPERTSDARQAAADAVSPLTNSVQRGEILFREGDRLSAAHVAQVDAMRASRAERSFVGAWLGVAAFVFAMLATVDGSMRRYVREDRDGIRNLGALGSLLVLVALTGKLLVSVSQGLAALLGPDVPDEALWFLLPVAGGATTVRLLMGTARTVAFAVSAAVVSGLVMQLDGVWVMYFLMVALASGGFSDRGRERIAVLRQAALTGLLGSALVVLLWLASNQLGVTTPLSGPIFPTVAVVAAFASGLISGVVVLALVPLFELAGFVTDYRLLELASLNHPLMRNLMLRAPGTYHHSVVVGTLAEAACEAIGANSLQAKVAAYFHDIGKAIKPQYFVENQRGGANRHNDLEPAASARVIIDHVHQGVRMAEEHRLPKPILDNIRMHHGTGLLYYFHARAVQLAGPAGAIDESLFRYPGPKPSNREAGVIMLADKVEAATRTLKHPTEANLRAMIDRVIGSVMADGQFSECPLTFREIYTTADTFTRVLLGIYHQRIEYPQTAAVSALPAQGSQTVGLPDTSGFERGFTLELDAETVAAARASSRMWTADAEPDEDTDYESARHLPGEEE
jgi:putative nucleotidyltransferase with HDIG domain